MNNPIFHRRALTMACMSLALGSLTGCSLLGPTPSQVPTNFGGVTISSSGQTKADGSPAAVTPVGNVSFGSAIPPGERMYSLFYWSQGHRVQGYLDVPPGTGPFPLLVYLHGGYFFSQPPSFGESSSSPHSSLVEWSPGLAEGFAWPSAIVFFPNYAGYGPSYGPVGNIHSNYLDVINGLTALAHLRGLYIRSDATYLDGASMGGTVAMMLAEYDKQVRAVCLVSPWPGDIQAMTWLLESKSALDATDSGYLFSFSDQPGYGTNLNSAKYHENSFQYHLVGDMPILIVAGRQDPYNPPALMTAMYQRLKQYDPHVQLDFFPGGHAPSSPAIVHTISS